MFYTMSFGLEKIQSYTFMMMGSLMYGVSQFILREITESKFNFKNFIVHQNLVTRNRFSNISKH